MVLDLDDLLFASSGGCLCLCDWISRKDRDKADARLRKYITAPQIEFSSAVIDRAREEIAEYLAGLRQEFDIPLLLAGTPFQHTIWQELQKIPYGATVSYAEIARRAGHPRAVRAAASAIAANPLSLFIPCHRVIPSGCGLPQTPFPRRGLTEVIPDALSLSCIGNYAGSSLRKFLLLTLEAKHKD